MVSDETMEPRKRRLELRFPHSEERFRGGLVLSFALHGGIIAAAIVAAAVGPDEMFRSAGGPGVRGGGGGGGGSVVRFVELPQLEAAGQVAAPVAPRVAPPLELPRPDVTRLLQTAPRVEFRQAGPLTAGLRLGAGPGSGGGPGSGTGSGGGVGSGQGTGVGSGQGPGTGGEGGTILPPGVKLSILPADRPRSVRGKEYAVRFWVNAQGRVTHVEVEPEIEDRDYRGRFLEQMYQFQFTPARTLDGQPVDGQIVIRIAL
jgi:protein TonB